MGNFCGCLPRKMAKNQNLNHINELPEEILLDILSWVPAWDLLCRCQLVCSKWRCLVGLLSLWRRKCHHEGYLLETSVTGTPDWKMFYFLCSVGKNLLKNPCGEDGFNSWIVRADRPEWMIEEVSGALAKESLPQYVHKCFRTQYGATCKGQRITLRDEGYLDEQMDEVKPDIVVEDWFCGDPAKNYMLLVELLSADHMVLQQIWLKNLCPLKWRNNVWCKVMYTFRYYPPGVRHIEFTHGHRYGADLRVTNSSITIAPGQRGKWGSDTLPQVGGGPRATLPGLLRPF